MASFPTSSAFVGRTSELSALHSAYQDERVHTVLVDGEAGIGKSRLVQEFTTRLGSAPLVLVGRCLEFGNEGLPFAPFIALLRGLVQDQGAAAVADLLPGPHPALARWLPELVPQTGPVGDRDRIWLFGEILTLLERVAATRPLVLVVEDLHWADSSSRELLTFLVANLTHPGVLLLATYRPTAAGGLRPLVAELARTAGVQRISPGPLSRHEVGRQLAALRNREPEPAVIARVHERSQGNPLFVEALSDSPEGTPAELQELLLAGLPQLPSDARYVLRVASVASAMVAHPLLEAVCGLTETALHEALRQLVDRRLLLAGQTGYAFRHELIRQAVYDALLPAERTRLHARLAQALGGDPALLPAERQAAELAAHAYAAGAHRQALAASWRAAAASEGAGRLHLLERVLELWEAVPQAAATLRVDRLTVLEQAVDASHAAGATARGIQLSTEALGLVDAGAEPHRAAHLYYQRARLASHGNTSGRGDLQRALALLPAGEPAAVRGNVLAELAAAHVFASDHARGERAARAAIEAAEQLGDASLAARAHAMLGLATAAADPASALDHLARAHAAAQTATDPQALLTVAMWESAVRLAAGEYATAIEVIQQGIRAAHETYQYAKHGPILVVKWVQALTALGRWAEAIGRVDETLAAGQLPPLSEAALLICRAEIVLAQGEPAAAQTAAAAAERLLGDDPWVRQYRLKLRVVQCRLALHRDEPGQAQRLFTATLAGDDLTTHPHEGWPLLVAGAQIQTSRSAHAGTDEQARASIVAARAELAVRAAGLPSISAVDSAHRAVLTATLTEAATSWDRAVHGWRRLRQPYELAQSLLGAAEAHLAAGSRRVALPLLQEAAAVAAELGAAPVSQAARQLARRGRLPLAEPAARPSTSDDPPPHALTARELEVLRLVADGRTNRQIAAELYISSNTAGVHVSRILTKLGVSTRTEAAALTHRRNLLAGSTGPAP